MAHEISVTMNGTTEAVFGFGEVPWWHSDTLTATVLDRAVSFDEVFSIAFPWTADMEQLQYADGALSSQHGIRRSDTKAELGVHSGKYGNIQPRKLFDFCAAFFEDSKVPIASAISMRGGKVLNISARLGEINILNSGDIHKSYLCFVNSFDGTIKAHPYISMTQPVCMNTTNQGLANAEYKMTYKHTKHVEKRIENDIVEAKSLIQASIATQQSVKDVLEQLAQVRPSKEAYAHILDELFGDSTHGRTTRVKEQFTQLVANGVNAQAYPDFRGTGYGIYTALTDYVDHYQAVRQTDARTDQDVGQIRLERSTIGSGAVLKADGLKILEKVLVLADGSVEDKPTYVDMAYGNSSESVWPSIKPMDPYPYDDNKDSVTYTPIPVNNTPIWDSLELTDEEWNKEVEMAEQRDQAYDNPESDMVDTVIMYTTLDQADFPCHTSLESVIETLPSGVSMKLVKCSLGAENALKMAAEKYGCAVFTEAQWADLHKEA